MSSSSGISKHDRTKRPTAKRPSLPPVITLTKFKDTFSLGGRQCTVYDVHNPGEVLIDTKTIIERGKENSLNLDGQSGLYFFQNRNYIPDIFSSTTFVFPLWGEKGFIQIVNFEDHSPWWCSVRCPDTIKWGRNCRLVYISPELMS